MKKGFTLVELLAVIELLAVVVILGVLSLIVTSIVGPTVSGSKENLSSIQQKKIEEAAKTYYIKEGNISDDYNQKTCINLSELLEKGYIDSNTIVDPKNGEAMYGSVKITSNDDHYTYKYQDTLCTNIDLGQICKLATSTEDKYEIGNEFICEVAPNVKHNFYLLSTNVDDTLNLIMDSNICDDGSLATDENTCLVEWYKDDAINTNGPITAMQYLFQATLKWEYISNIQIDYEDEGNNGEYGYSTIKTEDDITTIRSKTGDEIATLKNLKARLPEFSEINEIGTDELWLYKNLKYDPLIDVDQSERTIENISGYWTLSSLEGYVDRARYASQLYQNIVSPEDLLNSKINGIRPVITISKQNIE